MGVALVLSVSLLCAVCVSAVGEKHSLYYIYSALSKDVALPGIHEFTALGLLDDREIDYYNSKEQKKIPKQDWMMERMQEDYWEKGTQSRKSKEQWFKVNVEILMQRMNHNNTDLHVLQWRHGCEIDDSSGSVKFLKGIDEYSYDGSEFLSFDDENMRWIAPVAAAEATKRKWDGVAILNQYTKGYLEKECVDWLTKFMDYGKEELRKQSPPDVKAFAKKSVTEPDKLTLTCMATGFYPKDVEMCVRKYRTSIPEHLLTSSGVRPNGDGTYQLRKSLDIHKDDEARYDCYVSHSSLNESVIKEWDHKCHDCKSDQLILIGGGVAGLIVVLALLAGGIALGRWLYIKKRTRDNGSSQTTSQSSISVVIDPLNPAAVPLNQPVMDPLNPAAEPLNQPDPQSADVNSDPPPADHDSGRGTHPNSDASSQSAFGSDGSSHGSTESVRAEGNQPRRTGELDALLPQKE